ncbi:MAG: hypothetical protein ACFE9L_12045 [Candidatus Hodarchaeota archaeon]
MSDEAQYLSDKEYQTIFQTFCSFRKKITSLLIDFGLLESHKILDLAAGHGFMSFTIRELGYKNDIYPVGLTNDLHSFTQVINRIYHSSIGKFIQLVINSFKHIILFILSFIKGIWNNFYWVGIIGILIYLFFSEYGLFINLELLIIVGFFFSFGIIYPYQDRVANLVNRSSNFVLKQVVSAYSMLSGSKLRVTDAIYCSRCLRGIERNEFQSLIEIKGKLNPPYPFCGFSSWVGYEYKPIFTEILTREKELEKTMIQSTEIGVQDAQKAVISEKSSKVVPSEQSILKIDEKVVKKGKFPDYQLYKLVKDLGASNYSELKLMDKVEAPDFKIAEKVLVEEELKGDLERELDIINELKTLYDSLLTGRIIFLLQQLEKMPNLSSTTFEVVRNFRNHQNYEIQMSVDRMLPKIYGARNRKTSLSLKNVFKPSSVLARAHTAIRHTMKAGTAVVPKDKSDQVIPKPPQETVITDDVIKNSRLRELANFSLKLSASDKEIKKWHEWYLQ